MSNKPTSTATNANSASAGASAGAGGASVGAVFCEVIGGLGNQLYGVAATLQYARQTGRRCWFHRTWPLAVKGARATYWHNVFIGLPQLDDGEWAKQTQGAKQVIDYQPGYRALPDHKNDAKDAKDAKDGTGVTHTNVQLFGYFQSPRYFDLSAVRDAMFPAALRLYAEQLLKESKGVNGGGVAFMHFRRGDYKGLQHVHNVLPLSYYEAASGEFGQHVRFIVFAEAEDADDIQKEIKQSTVLSRRECVFVDSRIPDYLQLLMMAQCADGGIVANSSFSVWAAYLQPACNTVVAPQKWFTKPDEAAAADLCLPHWIRL